VSSEERRSGMITSPVLVAVALLAACAGVPSGGGTEGELPFAAILHETSSGLQERRREVVRDEASWARLWERIHEGVTPRPALPPVDFSSHMLIAVGMGTRPSGGFDIKIRSVATREERLEVVVFESCPAPGDRVSLALTQPVEVVRLDRLTQAPTFRETRGASCR
jgi:hypothetical protein